MRLMLVALTVATVAIVAALPSAATARQQGRAAGQGPPVLTVERLRDNLYVLRGGARENSGVFIGQRGVVLVDVRGGWGQSLRDAIAKLTPKPITAIINTHSHQGHVTGNPEGFAPTVEIVAHNAAAARIAPCQCSCRTTDAGSRRARSTNA